MALFPPSSTPRRARIPAAGRPHYLYVMSTDGNQVKVTQCVYVRRTPNRAGSDVVFGSDNVPGYPNITVIDADRPGPIQFADDVVGISILYTSDAEFEAFCA